MRTIGGIIMPSSSSGYNCVDMGTWMVTNGSNSTLNMEAVCLVEV